MDHPQDLEMRRMANAARTKRMRDARRRSGICFLCGKARAAPKSTLCRGCQRKERERERLRVRLRESRAPIGKWKEPPDQCERCTKKRVGGWRWCQEHVALMAEVRDG